MNEKIPVPVTFNTHKHHFGFLTKKIIDWRNLGWEEIEPELFRIGENLIDLYTGKLTVEEICNECTGFFRNLNINSRADLEGWIHPFEYKKIELNDSSAWIVKNGNNAERYIHIHPAKQSAHTIRVRASTLKSVLALMTLTGPASSQNAENLKTVNKIRVKFLKLSPVKSLHRDKGILKLWEFFISPY